MRTLFLLLLLGNVGYFAWEWHYLPQYAPAAAAQTDSQRHRRPGAAAQLWLLSELREGKSSPQPAVTKVSDAARSKPPFSGIRQKPKAPAASARADEAGLCFRVGGIEKQTEANAVAAALQAQGAQLIGRGAKQVQRRHYWVMLPAFPSRQQAQNAVRKLQRSGLKDYYLVRTGEHANAVSLGVFSSEESANRRLRQVSALRLPGRGPRIDHMERSVKRYWVAVRWPERQESGDWRSRLPAKSGAEAWPIPCGPAR